MMVSSGTHRLHITVGSSSYINNNEEPIVMPGCTALLFSAPKRRSFEKKSLLFSNDWRHRQIELRKPFTGIPPSLRERGRDIISIVKSLELHTLTDDDAEYLTSPEAPHCHIIDEVMNILFENLSSAPQRCVNWNTPIQRKEWKDDFRFTREWWLSLRILPYSIRLQEHYPPLIPWGIRSIETENQFISDLALHIRRKVTNFTLLHMDHIKLTPERVSILLFDGILRNEAHSLEFLSIPFCEISSASLLLLLCGLDHCRAIQPQLRYLNLSHNWIRTSCLNMLTILLERTAIRRLSLRGNNLGGADMPTFQDFLLHGCSLLEELDLSYTSLTRAEVCAVIRCLPQLHNLEILLLDGVNVPTSKAVALSTAIRHSKLTHVSLRNINACAGEAYQQRIQIACQRNKSERGWQRGQDTLRHLAETGSFFEAFARRAFDWVGVEEATALPATYRPFTTNEPSLPPIDEFM